MTAIQPFGMFVEILPGCDGLVHISEMDTKRVASMDISGFSVGQKVDVKVLGKTADGKLRLSRRAVLFRDSGIDDSSAPSSSSSSSGRKNGDSNSRDQF